MRTPVWGKLLLLVSISTSVCRVLVRLLKKLGSTGTKICQTSKRRRVGLKQHHPITPSNRRDPFKHVLNRIHRLLGCSDAHSLSLTSLGWTRYREISSLNNLFFCEMVIHCCHRILNRYQVVWVMI
jgi:hypothetical protein